MVVFEKKTRFGPFCKFYFSHFFMNDLEKREIKNLNRGYGSKVCFDFEEIRVCHHVGGNKNKLKNLGTV